MPCKESGGAKERFRRNRRPRLPVPLPRRRSAADTTASRHGTQQRADRNHPERRDHQRPTGGFLSFTTRFRLPTAARRASRTSPSCEQRGERQDSRDSHGHLLGREQVNGGRPFQTTPGILETTWATSKRQPTPSAGVAQVGAGWRTVRRFRSEAARPAAEASRERPRPEAEEMFRGLDRFWTGGPARSEPCPGTARGSTTLTPAGRSARRTVRASFGHAIAPPSATGASKIGCVY